MVAFARNTDVPASVHLGNRVAARTRNGVFRNGKYEGRLVKTESLPSVPDAAKVKVENEYDYVGRRVTKTVSSDFSGGGYSTTNVTTFVYDGWLPVAEITDDGSAVSTNFNVWGLDLSGSSQGAGGVGGSLATIQDGESYFTCMDGNGNVCQYVADNGAVVARREYDPFGGTAALTGVKKNDFSAWFSTKPLDRETGLYAYTFRYYDPELGRWQRRDPLEEVGGLNLYTFVRNLGPNSFDILGLADKKSLFGKLMVECANLLRSTYEYQGEPEHFDVEKSGLVTTINGQLAFDVSSVKQLSDVARLLTTAARSGGAPRICTSCGRANSVILACAISKFYGGCCDSHSAKKNQSIVSSLKLTESNTLKDSPYLLFQGNDPAHAPIGAFGYWVRPRNSTSRHGSFFDEGTTKTGPTTWFAPGFSDGGTPNSATTATLVKNFGAPISTRTGKPAPAFLPRFYEFNFAYADQFLGCNSDSIASQLSK